MLNNQRVYTHHSVHYTKIAHLAVASPIFSLAKRTLNPLVDDLPYCLMATWWFPGIGDPKIIELTGHPLCGETWVILSHLKWGWFNLTSYAFSSKVS